MVTATAMATVTDVHQKMMNNRAKPVDREMENERKRKNI